jgi:hypothetical protein
MNDEHSCFFFYNAHTPHHSFLSFMSHTPADSVTGHLIIYGKLPDLTSRYDANPHVTLLLYAFSTRSFFSLLPFVYATCSQHIRQAESMSYQVLLYYSHNYYYNHFCFVFYDAFSLILQVHFTSLHSLQ